jgi:hypothetical protein
MDSGVMVNGSLPKSTLELRVGAEGLPNCRYLFVQIAVSPLIAVRNVREPAFAQILGK